MSPVGVGNKEQCYLYLPTETLGCTKQLENCRIKMLFVLRWTQNACHSLLRWNHYVGT